jgi:hypothetical protein
MPTVLRSGPYRIYFFSHEPNEPPHVHVDRAGATAKFWLGPVEAARSIGFSAREMTRIRRILVVHETRLQEAWNEFFEA